MITVSHRTDNAPMASLLAAVGFVPWVGPWADPDPDERSSACPVDAA